MRTFLRKKDTEFSIILNLIPLADLENESMFNFIYKNIDFTIDFCVMHTESTCNKCIKNDNDNYRFLVV